MSMNQDFLFVCPKFWKIFKNEVSIDWELIDKQGRVLFHCLNMTKTEFSSTKADLNLEG